MEQKIYEKIVQKKEFSELIKQDVERVYKKFDNQKFSDSEKIKKTRDLLRKVFSTFNRKIFRSFKKKGETWFLKRHVSTLERLPYYTFLYEKILNYFPNKKITVIDLGAGINGLSYRYFSRQINYIAVEGVGQFVDLMNRYFKQNNFSATAHHESLFNLQKIKKIICSTSRPRIVFLFKVIDSLEMVEKDFSKKLLKEICKSVDLIVLSFSTTSLIKKRFFKVKRGWILNFLNQNFRILETFKSPYETYIFFMKK